jgi:hypothetical protein
VELGGERQTDVAATYATCGHRDGSGVHRVAQRLEAKVRTDRTLQARLDAWRAALSSVKS